MVVRRVSRGSHRQFNTSWPNYACDWSETSTEFCPIAIASFLPSLHNYIQVVTLADGGDLEEGAPAGDDEWRILHDALAVEYVTTKVMWSPTLINGCEYLVASGDGISIWKGGDEVSSDETSSHPRSSTKYMLTGRLVSKPTVHSHEKKTVSLAGGKPNPPAPITSFDWCRSDPKILVSASYDTTCTIWCLETGTIKTQLIAHDKEVFDVAFSPISADSFVSVGADGSLRLFDIR